MSSVVVPTCNNTVEIPSQKSTEDKVYSIEIALLIASLYAPLLNTFERSYFYRHKSVINFIIQHKLTLNNYLETFSRLNLNEEIELLSNKEHLSTVEKYFHDKKLTTIICNNYPVRWLSTANLNIPPVVWMSGNIFQQKAISIVGSRKIDKETEDATILLAEKVALEGYTLCSGGANGTDTIAANAYLKNEGSQYIEILPRGFTDTELEAQPAIEKCLISKYPPGSIFTAQQAHERNRFIYAFSNNSYVMHARCGKGGSWSGATDAIKYKLSRVHVLNTENNLAHDALCSLGANSFTTENINLA